MKKNKTILLLVFSVILGTGCSNDNEPSTSNQSITTAGILSGTISNYNAGTLNELKFGDLFKDNNIISTCAISSDGKFSMTLPVPTKKLVSGTTKFPGASLSNPKLQMGAGCVMSLPMAYKTSSWIGYICRSDTAMDPYSPGFIGTSTFYFYFDRSCTIKGKFDVTTEIWYYDMTVTKGWNEIARTVDSTHCIMYTKTIPSGLKWYFYKSFN